MAKTTLRPSPTALLSPLCDFSFKAMFTADTKESNAALKDFISTILNREVQEVQLMPNEPLVQIARLLSTSNMKGDEWTTPPAYQISVLNFEFDKDDSSPLSWYNMRGRAYERKIISMHNQRGRNQLGKAEFNLQGPARLQYRHAQCRKARIQ